MNDMNKKDRHFRPKGELAPTNKITEFQMIEIRRRYDPSKTTFELLGKEFGISKHTVRQIVNGKTWRHIPLVKKDLIYNRGQVHPRTKFTEDDIRQIRKLFSGGCTQTSIAIIYGVSSFCISSIVRGRTWSHIK